MALNHKKCDRIMVWGFCGFIAGVSVLSAVLPQKAFSASENRYLQKKPDFTISSLADGSFGASYEQYLSDQFPWRNGLIGVKVGTERIAGKKDVNGVYFGKDDYLMERFEEEDLLGEQLDQNLEALASFGEYAVQKYGSDHLRIMLVPSASEVLTDRLPSLAVPYDQSRITGTLEKLLAVKTGDIKAEKLLIPVEQALAEKREEELYYRTDHHWTAKGAYRAYEAWALSMGFEPWAEDAYRVETVSGSFHGTIYSKVNVVWPYDTIQLYLPEKEMDYEVTYDGNGVVKDTLYSMEALEGRDQYRVYLDGNHGLTEIVNRNAAEDRKGTKLVVIKDSFAHSFVPFAVNHYETVTMVDLRYMNVDLRSWMEENQTFDVLVLYQLPGFSKDKNVWKMGLTNN